jgi:hypothetical protein
MIAWDGDGLIIGLNTIPPLKPALSLWLTAVKAEQNTHVMKFV